MIELPFDPEQHPDKAVAWLRDQITGMAMKRHRGQNRELSFVLAKMDEAEMWAKRYLEAQGIYVSVDKRRFLTDATDETDSQGVTSAAA